MELRDQPLAAALLDERIVLWRAGGRAVAFKDLCIHRGSALSLGSVQGENLVCGYHGWEYCAAGDCVRIPALPPEQPIPRKARVTAHDNDAGAIAALEKAARTPGLKPIKAEPRDYKAYYYLACSYDAQGDSEKAIHAYKTSLDVMALTFAGQHDGDFRQKVLDGLTVDYPDWWFNARPSNTEPLLRLNVEATTPDLGEAKTAELLARISS